MKSRKLKDAIYYECENITEASYYSNKLINEGYHLEKLYELAYLLIKDVKIVITYLHHYKDITKLEDFKKYEENFEIMLPEYDNNFLKVIECYNKRYKNTYKDYDKDIDKLLDNNVKHIINIVLDGLGTKILETNLKEDSFLRKHYLKSISAIFPSTTVAATTSMLSGKTPLETAWLGWNTYFKEVDKSLITFNGYDFYDNLNYYLDPYKLIPYKRFFDDYKIKGYQIMPDFKVISDINLELDKVLENINNEEENIFYVYNTMPDSLLHVYANYSEEVKVKILELDKKLENFAKKLKKDTALIITADHGHIACPKIIDLNFCPFIFDLLELPVQNEARCAFFKIKEGMNEIFEQRFKKMFSYAYDLYKSDDFINKGFLGNGIKHTRVDDFILDYVAVAKTNVIINYTYETDDHFKSHHAGLTKDEMLIPLIYYRGEL